jgi:REP element-mobilizing transposase RayT
MQPDGPTATPDLAATAMVNTTATARVARTTVGGIVGAYKSMVSNRCLDIYKFKNETMGQFWQRNYYEHIIRDEQSYRRISKYIINNPLKWTKGKFRTK